MSGREFHRVPNVTPWMAFGSAMMVSIALLYPPYVLIDLHEWCQSGDSNVPTLTRLAGGITGWCAAAAISAVASPGP